MKRTAEAFLAVGLAIVMSGCYHATIDTGLEPSTRTIERPWATSLVYGLVPPPVVKTAERCPNGVSRVETQLSFLNMLVANLTLGIFTPMNIKVTCAAAPGTGREEAAGPGVSIDANADLDQRRQEFTEAARLSLKSGKPVYVMIQ